MPFTVQHHGIKKTIEVSEHQPLNIIRNNACAAFSISKENANYYALIFNGKPLNLSQTLSLQSLNKHSWVVLKRMSESVTQVDKVRVCMQSSLGRFEGTFMSNTILFDILTSLVPKFSEGVPSITYMRQKVEGSMLFETTLEDLGILNGSALLRVNFTPGKFETLPSSSSITFPSQDQANNVGNDVLLPKDDAMDEEENDDEEENSGKRKAPKMILKPLFSSSSSSSSLDNAPNTNTPNLLLNPQPPTDPIERCIFYLGEIRRTISDPEYTSSMKTISKIIDNIINKPGEPMVRRMKTTNAAFSKKILIYPNCIQLLFSLGFTIYSDESGDYYMLKPENEDMKLLKDIQSRVHTIIEAQNILNQNNNNDEDNNNEQRINFDPYKPIITSLTGQKSTGKSLIDEEVETLRKKQERIMSKIPERNILIYKSTSKTNDNSLPISDAVEITDNNNIPPALPTVNPTSIFEEENENNDNNNISGKGDRSLVSGAIQRERENREKMMNFQTQAMRERDRLKKRKVYDKVLIKILFPDKYRFQAYFGPKECINDVLLLIKTTMKSDYQNLGIQLYTSPPKVIYKPTDVLFDLNLGAACVFYLSWKSSPPPSDVVYFDERFITDEDDVVVRLPTGVGLADDSGDKKKNMLNALKNKLFH